MANASKRNKMNKTSATTFFLVMLLSGCAIDATKTDTPKQHLTGSSFPGTYSLYGKSMQRDEKSGLMYIDVYVGGGGDRNGSEKFSNSEIQRYSEANGFKSYEVVKVEYSLFPLSKYRFFVQYK